MTALVKKIKDGRAYWYATDSARVNGQPRVVRQRYLGTVESIEAAFDAAFEPESIDVVEFGATAAMWALANRINFGLWVDALLGPQATGLSVGAYLQAAAVNRAVAPRSKRGFLTFISSTNGRADIAQRGHAKNKRFDLRLVGLALACSTDHRIPLGHIATAGNAPDAKVFAAALPKLVARLEAVGVDPASVTVVFDKGNNSETNLAEVDAASIGFVGSLVPTQHRDLLTVAD